VSLSDLSIRRPVLTWIMMLALAVFGVMGYSRLGVDRFPKMEWPGVFVQVRLEGAAPGAVEDDVTDVLEEAFSTINGVRKIKSWSTQGAAQLYIEFNLGVDIDVAAQDVRDKIDISRRDLPREMDPPTLGKFDAGQMPIVWAPIWSERAQSETYEYVKRQIKPQLETIPGVAGTEIVGGLERNIRIWIDGEKLRSHGLAASDVLAALRREHIDRPGGLVEGAHIEWSVKTDAEFHSVAELEQMVVSDRGDAPIRLRDVARVEDGTEDVRTVTLINGQPGMALAIRKQADANTVAIVDELLRRLDEIRANLPEGIHIADHDGFIDFSAPIRESVDETLFALVFGGLLAVLVVFVFLRRTRPTLIVAAAIPLSLVATFGLVWLCGYTLNTMTLLGMTLAIGVVIDDAIIVLENIERHREGGKPARQAASDGTRQIAFAASAATFSVAAVFVPVAFAEGQMGAFLSEFGLTVAGSVVISLFVALTLTPMLASRMPPPKERAHGSIYHRLERGQEWIEHSYRRVLDWSLGHRLATAGIALGALAFAIVAARHIPGEFFPDSDMGFVFMEFRTPPGTSLETTAEHLARNGRWFLEQPEVRSVFSRTGGSHMKIGSANEGGLSATLAPRDQRERSARQIMNDARKALARIPGQKLSLKNPMSFSGGSDFQIYLVGNKSLNELDRLSDQMIDGLQGRGGFVDVNKSLELGLPEVRVVPDREKAAALGVDAATLAETVQVMIGGLDVGTFKDGQERHDIRMRLLHDEREQLAGIENLWVRARSGELVELRNLVRLETGVAASTITRLDRLRAVEITAGLEGKKLDAAIRDAHDIGRRILPEGVKIALGGDAEQMRETSAQFALMLGLAILVIYMVLAAQFESFTQPLTVMLAVPFSMVGGLGGLWLMGMTLNLFSMIGIVLLAGLVTKNSILLVDYANQLRDEGMEKAEAMRRAAPVRMRPVMMTALAMIFGVLPAALGVGPGAETRAPMAVATAAGMLTSVLLTLLVVPVFYLALDDFSAWARRLAGRARRAVRRGGSRPADTVSAR
jgi:HAE1 family hydrophobic/amphiphilic exporter-1